MNELYREELIDSARNPSNYGDIPDADRKAESYNASCGDRISITFRYNDDQTKIAELKWLGEGCIISQAGMSLLSTAVIGKKVAEVREYSLDDMLEIMKMQQITPGRQRCLMLGLTTLQKALKANTTNTASQNTK